MNTAPSTAPTGTSVLQCNFDIFSDADADLYGASPPPQTAAKQVPPITFSTKPPPAVVHADIEMIQSLRKLAAVRNALTDENVASVSQMRPAYALPFGYTLAPTPGWPGLKKKYEMPAVDSMIKNKALGSQAQSTQKLSSPVVFVPPTAVFKQPVQLESVEVPPPLLAFPRRVPIRNAMELHKSIVAFQECLQLKRFGNKVQKSQFSQLCAEINSCVF